MTPFRLLLLGATALALSSAPANAKKVRHRTPAPVVKITEPADPQVRIVRANEAARVQPDRGGYFNAIQQYAFADGSLFQIYTAPGQVTDIVLETGEELVGPGPVASGDTVRWVIGDTVSGSGPSKKVHILVKPTRADISTNLIINTNRRTYHLELRSTASTYMASVSWSYPQDGLIVLRSDSDSAAISSPTGIDFDGLNFRYKISGDKAKWRPVRVFDDGTQVFVEFGSAIASDEMPPLFVIGPDKEPQLVNYRVRGRYLVVDRLFDRAELRLGAGKVTKKVRIDRQGRSS